MEWVSWSKSDSFFLIFRRDKTILANSGNSQEDDSIVVTRGFSMKKSLEKSKELFKNLLGREDHARVRQSRKDIETLWIVSKSKVIGLLSTNGNPLSSSLEKIDLAKLYKNFLFYWTLKKSIRIFSEKAFFQCKIIPSKRNVLAKNSCTFRVKKRENWVFFWLRMTF